MSADAVVIDRLTELLVARDRDETWWSALAGRLEQLGEAVAAHDAEPAARCRPWRAGATPAAAELLLRDHVAIADRVEWLMALVVRARTEPDAVSRVLSACTEVIALVREHGRGEPRAGLAG